MRGSRWWGPLCCVVRGAEDGLEGIEVVVGILGGGWEDDEEIGIRIRTK